MSCQCASSRLHESLEALPSASRSTACSDGGIDVPWVLAELARAWPGPLSVALRYNLDVICRKIAVTDRLLARYEDCWKPPTSKQPLSDEQWRAARHILAAWSDALAEDDMQRGLSLKLLNAVLTALDARSDDDSLRIWSRDRVDAIAIPSPSHTNVKQISKATIRSPRVLPMTVLAYEGPCTRAYLAMLARAGLRPRRILLMVLSEHPFSGKPVGRWFPGRLRTWYAEKTQDMSLNYWPRRIRFDHPRLVSAIAANLAPLVARPKELFDEMYGPPRYEDYADTVDRVIVGGLRDDAIYRALRGIAPGTILFTGGGILPSRLIDIPGLRFLHVHPGYLPHVRGADGLLWSLLVRGQPATSCFYQAAGLDTGDVIATREYPRLAINATLGNRPDDQMLYRALFGFIDPLLRAELLADVLADANDPSQLETLPQDTTQGITYHFMHPALRKRALEVLFPSE